MPKFTLASPSELGFPAKFERWYDDQLQAIERITLNQRRVTALAMPTGSGKTLTGIAGAKLHPKVSRAVYMVGTRGLQDQISADKFGTFDLRGARNYPCYLLEPRASLTSFRYGCDEGPCRGGDECNKAPNHERPNEQPLCEYYGRVWEGRTHEFVLTNYSMWLAQNEYAQGLGKADMLILDEAHDIAGELESFLSIDLTRYDVHMLDRKRRFGHDMDSWKRWAKVMRERLDLMLTTPGLDIQRKIHLKDLQRKTKRLEAVNEADWVVEESEYKATFTPVSVAPYAEDLLFRHVEHIVLMSATLTPKTLTDLGLKAEDFTYWEAPSRFKVSHRPVIVVNTSPGVRVDARMGSGEKHLWMRRIDRLIDARRPLDWKAIIHSVSYERAQDIFAASDHSDIMIVHTSSDTKDAVQLFKDSPGPRVLVSPAVMTGYDFADDQCRYQIIAKVPMPDMRSAAMKARAARDKDYSGYLAMQKLVQATGRPVRNPWDWAETFIIDDHFVWFIRKYRKHAPRWFHQAVEYVETFPEPLTLT